MTSPQPSAHKQFRYYDLIMAAFVTSLLCSSLIGPGKVCTVMGFSFGAGILFFPFAYLFGDILTEVYGYARSRRVVWAGFGATLFATLMSMTVLSFEPAPQSQALQSSLEMVFGSTPRIVCASVLAYLCGEFCNSLVLAKMKLWTEGRHLWMRTIGSTVVGEAVDTLIFYPVAFLAVEPFIRTFYAGGLPSFLVGGMTFEQTLNLMAANYALKVAWEALATPFTYRIVGALKRAESEDYYDRDTNFTPFSLATDVNEANNALRE